MAWCPWSKWLEALNDDVQPWKLELLWVQAAPLNEYPAYCCIKQECD